MPTPGLRLSEEERRDLAAQYQDARFQGEPDRCLRIQALLLVSREKRGHSTFLAGSRSARRNAVGSRHTPILPQQSETYEKRGMSPFPLDRPYRPGSSPPSSRKKTCFTSNLTCGT